MPSAPESKRFPWAVTLPPEPLPVEKKAAERLSARTAPGDAGSDAFRIAVAGRGVSPGRKPGTDRWAWLRLAENGGGELVASHGNLLYAAASALADGLEIGSADALEEGLFIEPAFDWIRPHYDYVLTQTWRTRRKFDEEAYIRKLAESGYSHIEVNGLSTPLPFEPGVPNEYYNQFYSYCAALSQFVDSKLTRGIYPHEYLAANLNRLKKLAALGREYGLKPGILCFEPRTLPEHFFRKYPTLRGARVDHPFRSHVPRYTMAQDHPETRKHYAEMLSKLMDAVPELDYMSLWTNDSGAGFEHTGSLYVGRNGGPYMIREWRSHEKIAEAAGNSIIRYMRLLRDTAAEVNPDFQVILRIEPFKVEHDVILRGLKNGLSYEAPSFLVRGYHLPYSHPKYPEQESAAGTLFHTRLDAEEKQKLESAREAGFEPNLIVSGSSAYNLEPLLGIPFPRMVHEKLRNTREAGIRQIGTLGGLTWSTSTPYWPVPEVIRAAQLTPDRPVDDVLQEAAARWVGEDDAATLVSLWDDIETAVAHFPIVPLFSNFGFVWMRTWVRPIVPDIEAVPQAERDYYERFLVSTPNNPSINDLGRDVLFDLITQESGEKITGHFDGNVLPRIDAVLEKLASLKKTAGDAFRNVLQDLEDRARALRCWAETQRNTCAWVAGVHGFIESDDEKEKDGYRSVVQEMVERETENARALLDLWNTAETEFMVVSDVGETSFIYGENFGELIERKIRLMEQYGQMEPRIDREIIWRLV